MGKQYGAEKPPKKKKTRKERMRELRDDGFSKGSGIKYDKVFDRHVDDDRFERELEFKKKLQEDSSKMEESNGPSQPSATYDAFMRMATGKQERTIADKIADSNRPTWEQYKVEHEDKLDMTGAELKKMVEYRKELDANREKMLREAGERREGKKQEIMEEQLESGDDVIEAKESKKKERKKKKKKKKKRKAKDKKKKEKRKRKQSSSSGSDSSDSTDASDLESTKNHGKKQKIVQGPVRLSAFLDQGDDDI